MDSKYGGIGNDDRLFERARQSMALSDYLEGFLGEKPKKAGGHYRFDSCPHCGEGHSERLVVFLPENQSYYCHKCGAKGTIIDVAMVAQNLSSPLHAAKFLLGEDMNSQTQRRAPRPAPQKTAPEQASIRPVLEKILQLSANATRPVPEPVADYLRSRGLSDAVINLAWKRKFFLSIAGDPRQVAGKLVKACGKDALASAGFINEKGSLKIIPYRPLVFPLSHAESAEFRIIQVPRDRELKAITKGPKNHDMWFWKGETGNTEAMVVEGAIDLLSAVAMGFKGTIFGLPGVTGYGDGSRIVAGLEAIQCNKVWMALDNDEAGKKATAALSQIINKFNPSVLAHEDGCNDLNDILVKRRAAKAKATAPAVTEVPVAPVPAPMPAPEIKATPAAPVETSPEPAAVEPAPKKRRSPSSKPRTRSKKKPPLSFWGRIRLAVKVLTEGRP